MTFADQILDLYKRPHRIHPFVGEEFRNPTPDNVRAVVMGINSYVSPKDWGAAGQPSGAKWFPGWFELGEHKFYRAIAKRATKLLETLSEPSWFLGGKRTSFPNSFYATNAIKT